LFLRVVNELAVLAFVMAFLWVTPATLAHTPVGFLLTNAVAVPSTTDDARAVPEVYFEWDGPVGKTAMERCHNALIQRGGEIVAAIVPVSLEPEPVRCLLLDHPSFQKHFAGTLPDWGIGVALPDGRTIALDYDRTPEIGRSLEEIFLHELTHALVFQAAGGVWIPTWLHEGAAMWHSGEWRFVDTVAVVLNGSLPPLWKLQGRFPANASWADQAYRTSLLAYEALRKDYGEDVVARLIAAMGRVGDFEQAFLEITGDSTEEFAGHFAGAMKLRFGWLFTVTRWPTLFVLLAVVFAIGAVGRLVRKRRQLAAMADDYHEGES